MIRAASVLALLVTSAAGAAGAEIPAVGADPASSLPPHIRRLTFFGERADNVSESFRIDLVTGQVTNDTRTETLYEEPEGIFPDGQWTCIETDRDNGMAGAGHQYIDVWKLALDGSGRVERLTDFTRFPAFKASNPVVRDDGRFMAFQMAKVGDPAGVGRGILVYDLLRAAMAPKR